MSSNISLTQIIARLVGCSIVGAATYFLLGLTSDWGLSDEGRLVVAVIAALAFLWLGGSVWRWIDEISIWS